MREILFRGKRVDNGEWVVGSLIKDVFYHVGDPNSIPYILSVEGIEYDCWEDFDDEHGLYEVIPETVREYTGLKDKKGNKIFEGDILRSDNYPFNFDGFDNYYAKVVWFSDSPAFGIVTCKNPKSSVNGLSDGNTDFIEENELSSFEIIGNIHDNPELLGEDKE